MCFVKKLSSLYVTSLLILFLKLIKETLGQSNQALYLNFCFLATNRNLKTRQEYVITKIQRNETNFGSMISQY